MCKNSFRDPIMVFVPEAPMMNVPAAKCVADPLAEKFVKAGKEFAERRTLSEDTIRVLEMPMIPKEDYLAAINGTV